jgi:polyphosphate kinase 2 (PPK2 family)
MSRKAYAREKCVLQVELLKLPAWVKAEGHKVVVLFEGRDAAGERRDDQTVHGASQSERRASCGA